MGEACCGKRTATWVIFGAFCTCHISRSLTHALLNYLIGRYYIHINQLPRRACPTQLRVQAVVGTHPRSLSWQQYEEENSPVVYHPKKQHDTSYVLFKAPPHQWYSKSSLQHPPKTHLGVFVGCQRAYYICKHFHEFWTRIAAALHSTATTPSIFRNAASSSCNV